jgi:ABC-type phosphate transport system substrate-binding protein
MNDDFLHRLRKPPRVEFLQELKAKLDCQPLPPAPPRRRLSFTKGLLTGLLLGGGAFVIAVIAGKGIVPQPVRSAMLAPAHWVTKFFASDDRATTQTSLHVPTLGPAWFPKRRAPDQSAATVTSPTQSAPAAADSGSSAAPAATTQNIAKAFVPVPGPTETILAQDSVYSLVSNIAAQSRLANIEHEGEESIAAALCDRPTRAHIVALSRRLTDEDRTCGTNNNRYFAKVIELKVGYQAVALARASLYGALKLTSRDLFLALSQRVPDPAHPTALLDNPYQTWNQVNPALPYDRIQVIGPPPESEEGKLAAELLLVTGCRILPARTEDRCHTLRTDGAYIADPFIGVRSYVERLAVNPTALGVFWLAELRPATDKLALTQIDGVEPNSTSLAAATYPASRGVYLSTVRPRFDFINIVSAFVPPDYPVRTVWGFTRLDGAERAAVRAKLTQWDSK